MERLTKYISSQFGNPKGFAGVIVSLIQNVLNNAMYRGALEVTVVQPDEKLLDIGYGNGHLLKKLYKKYKPDLYGIDISEDAKSMAEKKNSKAKKDGKLHLSVGDCCDLPYEDNTFSAITTINTIYFWEDTLKGFQEIYRTLLPERSFYNVVMIKEALDDISFTKVGYKKFELDEIISYAREAGFASVETCEVIKNRSYIVICTK